MDACRGLAGRQASCPCRPSSAAHTFMPNIDRMAYESYDMMHARTCVASAKPYMRHAQRHACACGVWCAVMGRSLGVQQLGAVLEPQDRLQLALQHTEWTRVWGGGSGGTILASPIVPHHPSYSRSPGMQPVCVWMAADDTVQGMQINARCSLTSAGPPQLWHACMPGGCAPVAPSAVAGEWAQSSVRTGWLPCDPPNASTMLQPTLPLRPDCERASCAARLSAPVLA